MLDSFISRIRNDLEIYLIARDRIFDARDVHEISRANTPTAFDANSELQPSILVKRVAGGRIPQYHGGSTDTIQIYFYERLGYKNTEKMRVRCRSILHDTQLVPLFEEVGNWRVWWDDDLLQIDDEALASSVEISNYRILKRDLNFNE